jgi:hypothetical protein
VMAAAVDQIPVAPAVYAPEAAVACGSGSTAVRSGRMRTKPLGKTCRKKRRRNSCASRVNLSDFGLEEGLVLQL